MRFLSVFWLFGLKISSFVDKKLLRGQEKRYTEKVKIGFLKKTSAPTPASTIPYTVRHCLYPTRSENLPYVRADNPSALPLPQVRNQEHLNVFQKSLPNRLGMFFILDILGALSRDPLNGEMIVFSTILISSKLNKSHPKNFQNDPAERELRKSNRFQKISAKIQARPRDLLFFCMCYLFNFIGRHKTNLATALFIGP